jgi:PhzF family phenazine biosynthesis protein
MMKFYIVDAFTDTLFGGNPAGVVLLEDGADFPEEQHMLLTAAELRYSETAFVKALGNGGFHTRYFTPTDEVDLCGHATIGAFTVLLSEGIVHPGDICLNQTLAGDLKIVLENGRVMMDMATPQELGSIQSPEALVELYEVMGLTAETVVIKDNYGVPVSLFPAMISTGLPDIIMPVSTPLLLSEINPDFDALTILSQKYGVVGVHAFSLGTEDNLPMGAHAGQSVTAYCRNFAPLYGIPEEAATGTSNGALTYYLYLNGLLKPDDQSRFIQGREMKRPSVIESRLNIKDAALTIQVGGTGVILAKGELFI